MGQREESPRRSDDHATTTCTRDRESEACEKRRLLRSVKDSGPHHDAIETGCAESPHEAVGLRLGPCVVTPLLDLRVERGALGDRRIGGSGSEDSRRTHVHEAPNARTRRSFEQDPGARHVVVLEGGPTTAAAHAGCEVEDGVDARHRPFDRGGLVEPTPNDLGDLRGDPLLVGSCPDERAQSPAIGRQSLREVATEEAGAAGQEVHVRSPSAWPLARPARPSVAFADSVSSTRLSRRTFSRPAFPSTGGASPFSMLL